MFHWPKLLGSIDGWWGKVQKLVTLETQQRASSHCASETSFTWGMVQSPTSNLETLRGGDWMASSLGRHVHGNVGETTGSIGSDGSSRTGAASLIRNTWPTSMAWSMPTGAPCKQMDSTFIWPTSFSCALRNCPMVVVHFGCNLMGESEVPSNMTVHESTHMQPWVASSSAMEGASIHGVGRSSGSVANSGTVAGIDESANLRAKPHWLGPQSSPPSDVDKPAQQVTNLWSASRT